MGWSTLEANLAALNDGASLEDISKKVDLVALNDYANSHPEYPLAGRLRQDLHAAASAGSNPVVATPSSGRTPVGRRL